jgi:hypothetical protein
MKNPDSKAMALSFNVKWVYSAVQRISSFGTNYSVRQVVLAGSQYR